MLFVIRRSLAFLVDVLVGVAALLLLRLVDERLSPVAALIYVAHRVLLPIVWQKGTIGRAIFKLQLRTAGTTRTPGPGRRLLREASIAGVFLGYAPTGLSVVLDVFAELSWMLLLVDLTVAAFRADSRGLRDLALGTQIRVAGSPLIPCPNCGEAITERAVACRTCGHPLQVPTSVASTPQATGVLRRNKLAQVVLWLYSPSGREDRSTLIALTGATFLVVVVASVFDDWMSAALALGVLAGMIWPLIAAHVRRLHDLNMSGLWVLGAVVPLGLVLLLPMTWLRKGQGSVNSYGPRPHHPRAWRRVGAPLLSVAAGGLLALTSVFPIPEVVISNDLGYPVQVVNCAEPWTPIGEGRSLSVNPSMPCSVFVGGYVACLRFPDQAFETGSVALSSMDRSLSEKKCASIEHYGDKAVYRSYLRKLAFWE